MLLSYHRSGEQECKPVTHLASDPHHQISCTLPAGNQLRKSTIVFQR